MIRTFGKFTAAAIVSLLTMQQGANAQQYELLESSNQALSIKICATCHGSYGHGNPVVGGPSLAGLESWYIKKQLQNFRSHYRGTQADYLPGYEMRASVETLSDLEIESLLASIQSWEARKAVATISGDSSHGAELYASCAACHGAGGEGNELLGAPGLTGRDDWYMFRQLKLFESGYRGSHPDDIGGAQMRAGMQALQSDQDMNDVLAYINTLE